MTLFARTFIIFGFLVVGSNWALACSCANGNATACSELRETPVVFSGRVTRDTGGKTGTRNGIMVVEEVLHGLGRDVTEVEVDTMPRTSCYMPLENGERYVIYGSRDPKNPRLIHYHACSFSFRLRGNEVLMDALRAAENGAPSRIIGAVKKRTDRIGIGSGGAGTGIKIIAEREGQRIETTTFGEGVFEFKGISPGTWKLKAESPGLIYEPGNDWPRGVLEIPVNSCSYRTLTIVADGHVRGTVRDRQGQPVEGVPVEIFGFDIWFKDFESKPYATVLTQRDGTYDIGALSAQEYILGINGKEYTDSLPYPPTFYGGTSDRTKATRLSLKEKESRSGIDLVLPEKRKEAVLVLRVQYSDGTLVTAGGLSAPPDSPDQGIMGVRLLDLAGTVRSEGRTPENITNGNIRVPVWIGESYSVEGWRFETSLEPRGQGVGVSIRDWEGSAGPIKILQPETELTVVLKPKTK